MDPHLVVRITTPKSPSGKRTGTGYVIAPNLIITALHVVKFEGQAKGRTTLLEWTKLNCDTQLKSVVSGSWEQHDIAILECEFPDKLKNYDMMFPALANQFAPSSGKWECAGYPKIHQFELKDAVGIFGSDLQEVALHLTLIDTVDRNNVPKEVADHPWGGMSGASVFDSRTKQLQAIITDHNKWMKKQLVAVSIPWLLKNDKDFCNILGISKTEIDFSEAIKHLKNYPVMASYLLGELVTESSGYKEDAEFIIEQLTKKPISTLIQLIYKLQKNHDDNTKKIFSRLLRLLLPCIFDRSYTPFISNNKNPEAGVVVLPYATDLSAEMLMAAFDKREACFRVLSNDNKLIARAGRYRLPVAPEAGVVSTEKNIADIDLDLKNRFGKNCNLGAMHIAMDKELFKITDEPSYSEFDTEEVQLLIQSELRRRDGKAPSYYWIFIFGKNEDENQRMRRFAVELKLKYPEIVQLSLKREVLLIKNERDLFFQLAETQQYC